MAVEKGLYYLSLNIVYTAHLKFRLKVRNIPSPLPKKIFKEAKEHYRDSATGHYVAVHKLEFKNKMREFALTYDKKNNAIEIITKSFRLNSSLKNKKRTEQ